MIAKRMPSILGAIETSKVHGICGLSSEDHHFVSTPPVSPHHTISDAGQLLGTAQITPGELRLAHNVGPFPGRTPRISPLDSGGNATTARAREGYGLSRRRPRIINGQLGGRVRTYFFVRFDPVGGYFALGALKIQSGGAYELVELPLERTFYIGVPGQCFCRLGPKVTNGIRASNDSGIK